MTTRLRVSTLLLFVLTLASSAAARVLSYAPYTNRTAIPAFQAREERYFALIEHDPFGFVFGPQPAHAEVVLYDAQGIDEPRVVLTTSGFVEAVALRGRTLLAYLMEDGTYQFRLSTDGGATWKRLSGLDGQYLTWADYPFDTGGPHTHGLWGAIKTGTAETPFIFSTYSGVWAVDANGTTRSLAALSYPQLVGRNPEGSHFLVHERYASESKLYVLDIAGHLTYIDSPDAYSQVEGWLSPDGTIFVANIRPEGRFLYAIRNFQKTLIAGPAGQAPPAIGSTPTYGQDPNRFLAIPSYDYRGAWMIQRDTGKPTNLLRYTPDGTVSTMWSDVSGPDVEALHAGASGDTLLVQVHRARQQPERFFVDPALAIWRVGEPAPAAYDELFLNEDYTKGFVHLDVDAVRNGAPFVFDSGMVRPPDVIISPSPVPAPGGSDVTQEWGVVRASLKQRLVVPGVARLAGAYGSFWQTDLVIYNPSAGTKQVKVRYSPLADNTARVIPLEITLLLNPKEQRVVKDALNTLFHLNEGGGGLEFEPESGGIFVNSRTYTKSGEGTFGFGMQGIDVYASTSPRFPVTFSGAFPGENFRTNLVLTDTSGRGTEARLEGRGEAGPMGLTTLLFGAPIGGLQQINGLNVALDIASHRKGALIVTPTRGTAIATVVSIDNRTNDPTYFPPDLPAPVLRTIPAIAHADGAHGAKFRSDLYFVNPSAFVRTMRLEARSWTAGSAPVVRSFIMQPNEARVITDALTTMFGLEGIARFRYNSDGDTEGVRVTSRSYTVAEDGGTFGSLVPPLNNFQSAAAGEALEIIGITAGPAMRANVGLVDLSPLLTGPDSVVRIRIIDDRGHELDSFTMHIPLGSGTQINDIFTARGIAAPASAIIRVETIAGLVGAYATMTDNVTNDSTFVGASLAASE
ncbi:MAG: hypothetical protein QOH21_2974 [Acidobacteriota bacterium]|jgi:hypothetical protein|nr:hypothetical protein [Acidobacteriota bacterium]